MLLGGLRFSACGGGGGGGNPNPGTGLAPLITGLTVGTPIGDNVSVTLTVDPKDPSAIAEARLETSQDNTTWTPTSFKTVNPGSPASLTFNLTSLPSGCTSIRAYTRNCWGTDTWWYGDVVTIVDNGTITINNIFNGDSMVILRNNVEVHNFYNNTGGSASTTFVGPAGPANKYKIIRILGTHIAATRPLSLVDAADNNVFQMDAGGQLIINSFLSSAVNGRMPYNITGSGWTSSYQAPANVGGTPAWTVTTVATGGNYSVVSPSVVTATYSQTENLVTFADPSLGTVYGTMNGDLLYFWAYAWNGAEVVAYRETVAVNATGNYFSGDVRIDFLGTGRWVTGTITGTR